MLEKFTIRNYLSFKEEFVVSMLPTTASELDFNIMTPTYTKTKMLKGLGVFGYNSSGKTNLFKALQFCKKLVLGEIGGVASDKIEEVAPFLLDSRTTNLPSEFEFEFWSNMKKYRLGFKVSSNNVLEEWLFIQTSQKESAIYIRDYREFRIGREFKREVEKFTSKIRPNELFITFGGRLYLSFAEDVLSWFRRMKILLRTDPTLLSKNLSSKLNDHSFIKTMNHIMINSGFGINGLKIQTIGGIPSIISKHIVYEAQARSNSIDFNFFKNESSGTIKFLLLLEPLFSVLNEGGLLIIDEIDAGLHILLGRHLLRLFYESNSKEKNAQLIFSSHNLDLWDSKILRRDQHLHMEKDEYGASIANSSFDLRVRKNEKVKNRYMKRKLSKLPGIRGDIQLKFDF